MFFHGNPRSHIEINGMTIDVEEIRRDLIDDIYALATVVSPAVLGELSDIEDASAMELVRLAYARGIDLNKYRVR